MKKAHPLLQLHDTDLMLASLRDAGSVSRLKRIGLVCDDVEALERARGRLVRQLEARWVTPYERALRRYGRGVVAVRDRVCQGCYITLPTCKAPTDQDTLTLCESCGRILYWR
jgi:predicted  nucleic acid-binding Zn-ribbon protein